MDTAAAAVAPSGRLTVKDKSAAAVQITAEQLLRETATLQREESKAPQARVLTEEQLHDLQVHKRKDFEDAVRRKMHSMGIWMSYAHWEAKQLNFRRARSVFERALDIDYENTQIWAKYIEMETKAGFVNSARNLYDRVVQLLPRLDRFWFNYAHFEEMLQNYVGARAVYERWVAWNPLPHGWMLYVKFEDRCNERALSQSVFERLLVARPQIATFLMFCKHSEEHREYERARAGYEKAIQIEAGGIDCKFFVKFAEFEERRREVTRATLIYDEAIRRYPTDRWLEEKSSVFQKRSGNKIDLETAILNSRKKIYLAEVEQNPSLYDSWFSLLQTEMSRTSPDADEIRSLAGKLPVPQQQHKREWTRYVYCWLLYVSWEELQLDYTKNYSTGRGSEHTELIRELYKEMIKRIPHAQFSFNEVWTQFAHFEIRSKNLTNARLVYGHAIGVYPNEELFRSYCDMERQLNNVERCRKICAKFIELKPVSPDSWTLLIDFELYLNEFQRAEFLFEKALEQITEGREQIWKVYIDFQANQKNVAAAHKLFERLLEETDHWRVYKALADFDALECHDVEGARAAYKKGVANAKANGWDEDRAALLEAWLEYEQSVEHKHAGSGQVDDVAKLLPTKLRKIKTVLDPDGDEWEEEETVLMFPDERVNVSTLKMIQAARKWKAAQNAAALGDT